MSFASTLKLRRQRRVRAYGFEVGRAKGAVVPGAAGMLAAEFLQDSCLVNVVDVNLYRRLAKPDRAQARAHAGVAGHIFRGQPCRLIINHFSDVAVCLLVEENIILLLGVAIVLCCWIV